MNPTILQWLQGRENLNMVIEIEENFKLVIKITDMNDLVAVSAFSLTTSVFIFCLPEYVVCLNAVHTTVLKMHLWERLFVLF